MILRTFFFNLIHLTFYQIEDVVDDDIDDDADESLVEGLDEKLNHLKRKIQGERVRSIQVRGTLCARLINNPLYNAEKAYLIRVLSLWFLVHDLTFFFFTLFGCSYISVI